MTRYGRSDHGAILGLLNVWTRPHTQKAWKPREGKIWGRENVNSGGFLRKYRGIAACQDRVTNASDPTEYVKVVRYYRVGWILALVANLMERVYKKTIMNLVTTLD